jgi:serine/threonine-protein kinase
MSVPDDEVRAELSRVQSSRIFHGTKLLSRLLCFIVDQSIAGNGESLKESVLGVDVFGRGPSFDPRLDPIVRVDARRLREKLAEYYNTEGASDRVIIELPKGHYTPVFSWRDSNGGQSGAGAAQAGAGFVHRRDSVAVLPFVCLNADPEWHDFSDGLTEEVITALARIHGLRVIGRSTIFCYEGKAQDIRRVGRELNVLTVLEGSVRRTAGRLRISARLLDATDCFHLWSEAWECGSEDIFAVQKEISESIENLTRQNFHKALSTSIG